MLNFIAIDLQLYKIFKITGVRLRGSASQHCLNGDRPSQWEMGNFDLPPQNLNP